MGGECKKTGFEERERWEVIAFEVNGGEEGALDFVGKEDWSAAGGELHQREGVSGHGSVSLEVSEHDCYVL